MQDERSGERIGQFVATEYPRLVGAVAHLCGSRPAAEDAVQEALVRAWQTLERGNEIDSLASWVVTVALNLSRSAARRRRAERRAKDRLELERPGARAHPSPAEAAEALDVRRALDDLPPRQREVTVLYYYLGFDVRSLAAALGISEGNAKSTLHDARRALASALRTTRLEPRPTVVADVHD